MNMFKRLINLFEPEIVERQERYTRRGEWTIFSKYARKVLQGQKDFQLSFDDYDVIRDTLKYYMRDIFAEKRLTRKGKYKTNPLGGIKDIRIGINPVQQQALMWVDMRNKKEKLHE